MNLITDILKIESTTCDYKEKVERKKSKSWLKSVSAFANTQGGALIFGVTDDGECIGLINPQADADFISEEIKAHLDPVPNYSLIPHIVDGKPVIEVNVKEGMQTPYYYYLDGSRIAYVRMGNESVQAEQQWLISLVLKGTNSTYDAQITNIPRINHAFTTLANTFESQTHKTFEEKMLESFGLVTHDGLLTNAGLLFADACPVYQSKLVCTRWDGLFKDNAIHDAEYQGNILMLLKYGVAFMKTMMQSGWVKMPERRLNFPDYDARAVFETLVNHLIHRDYTFVGAEVHIDVFDDRVEVSSPGGMYDGTLIQNRDITNVPSKRRNPIIADVFAQLDYMEKRGSGLRKICESTAKLHNYTEEKKPVFKSEAADFFTIIRNVNYGLEIIGTGIKTSIKTGIKTGIKTRTKIIRILMQKPTISISQIAEETDISRNGVIWQLNKLQKMGIILRVGPKNGGYWKFIENPQNKLSEE